MVEIGPGRGALTSALLDALKGSPLQVVEIDRDLAHLLRQRHAQSSLIVHESDALTFDFAGLGTCALRMVGNLPYNISTPLLFHLDNYRAQVSDQHFMLQKEVVERMVALPATPAYGRLSVMLQVHYRMEWLFDVPPAAFWPVPKVESSLVRMVPRRRHSAAIEDDALFTQLVAQAFGQRRKMLRNSLASFESVLPMSDYGLAPSARAEQTPVEAFVAYANALARGGNRHT